jgi:hypothetical protein
MMAKLAAAKAAGPKKASAPQGPIGGREGSRPQPDSAGAHGSTAPPPAVVEAPPPAAPTPAGGVVTKQETEEELRARGRRLRVRTFVRSMLTQGPGFMNARVAYHAIQPDVTDGTAKNEGYNLLQAEDVRDEMRRQLRAIDKAADLDDQWVYDRWRAIANGNLCDYMHIDHTGKVTWKVDSNDLTSEQQMVLREIEIDTKTGLVRRVKLANIDQAVLNVAKARQMVDGNRDAGAVDLAQRLTDRMNRAQKRLPRLARVFDNDTGEQVA